LHPFVAGFYVALLLALIAGALEALAHGRAAGRVRYYREYFLVGLELCIGAISIAVLAGIKILATLDFANFSLESLLLAFSTVKGRLIAPMLVCNIFVLTGAWSARRHGIENAPASSEHHNVSHRGTGNRIQMLEVSVSLVACAALVALNTLIFEITP